MTGDAQFAAEPTDPVKPSRKSLVLSWLVPFVLFLGACGWAAAQVDWSQVMRQLREASFPFVSAMGLAWIAALFLRPLRMMVLIGAMAPKTARRYWPIWSADMIAMAANSVIPMRAGDMMIAFLLRQSLGVPVMRGTLIMLVDRFFDFATVVVLFVVMLAAAPTVVPWAHDATVVLLIALTLLIAALSTAIRADRFWRIVLDRSAKVAPGARAEKWRRRVRDLLDGLAMINQPAVMAGAIVISVLMWTAITASYWFGVQAVWPEMSIPAAAFAASAVALGFVVPIAPGGFGVFHGVAVLALSLFSVPAEPALAFAIISHAFQMGSVLILGGASLLLRGISLRTLIVTPRSPT